MINPWLIYAASAGLIGILSAWVQFEVLKCNRKSQEEELHPFGVFFLATLLAPVGLVVLVLNYFSVFKWALTTLQEEKKIKKKLESMSLLERKIHENNETIKRQNLEKAQLEKIKESASIIEKQNEEIRTLNEEIERSFSINTTKVVV